MDEVTRAGEFRSRSSGPTRAIALALLFALGAALRVAWNDVSEYSRADEAVYVYYTRTLLDAGWKGYPDMCRSYLGNPEAWQYPTPLRWGYLALTTTTCRLLGSCDARTLAWLSTVAGVLVLGVGFLLARDLLGTTPALVAVALMATSPLQLALGRRALQDEVFCLITLAGLLLFVRFLDAGPGRRRTALGAAAVATCSLAVAVKESWLLLVPALLALVVCCRGARRPGWADAAVIAAPPLVFALLSTVLTGGVRRVAELVRVVRVHALATEFSRLYQSGPPHRVLLDQFVLAPLVCLLAVGACALLLYRRQRDDAGAQRLAVFLVVTLAAFGLLAYKNVRFVAVADPIIRLLAAWSIVRFSEAVPGRLPVLPVAVLAINAATEVALFRWVFVSQAVYDPVTANLLRALGMVPN